jgi:hypothetical protein
MVSSTSRIVAAEDKLTAVAFRAQAAQLGAREAKQALAVNPLYPITLRTSIEIVCLRGIADDLRPRMRQHKNSLSLAPVLLQQKRQIERAAETESVPAHARGIRQAHVGEALKQHGQQDDANGSPRQVRARTMMRAVAKGLVRIGLAQRVVVLAIFEGVLVSVGRRLDRHHGVALRDEAPANLRVLHNEP